MRKYYEKGMGFCFFLVCNWNDRGFFINRILEFFGGSSSVGCRIYSVLQMLKRENDNKKREPNGSPFILPYN